MPSEEHERMVREVLPRFAPEPGDTIGVMRRRWDDEAGRLAPANPLVRSRKTRVGTMRAAWVAARGREPSRQVLYVHGGGYVQGSIASYLGMASRVAQAIDARVLLFEYRLAPENPFPAALEDVCSAYAWLSSRGAPAREIIVMGDSAGGGLALATLLRLRDEDRALPGACVCFSPLTDFEASGDSAKPGAVDDPMIPAAAIPAAGELYAPGQLRNPLVSPVFGDFTGLPPLLIFVGTREVLLDDSVRVKEKAEAAGVDVTLVVRSGLTHAWPYFGPHIPETVETFRRIRSFVDQKCA
jgi:acetyl esterase/lipase